MEVANLWVKLNLDMSGLKRGLEQAKAQVAGLGSRLQSAMRAAEPGSKALAAALAGVVAGVGALGVKAVTMAGQMEQSRIAFTTMLGSAQKADAFLRDLYDFAAKTPFEFEGLQQASRQLLAFGFQAEQIVPMMTAIGNAVAGLGGGAEMIDRVTFALGQMRAKGKVSAEEMMQLAETGIPAWEILAQKIGVDIPTAMKMAEKGAIPAAQAIEALVTGMNERFPAMMEKQSSTLLGLWSTLKDNISMSLVAIGDEIVKTFDLKNKLAGAIEALSKLSDLLREKGLKGALAELFPPDLQMKITMIAGAIGGALIPAFVALGTAIWGAMAPLLPFAAAGAAIAGLAFVIYKNWGGIKDFFIGLWEGVKAKTVEVWEAIKTFFAQVWEAMKTAFLNLSPMGLIIKHWDDIRAAAIAIWTAIKDFVVGSFQWMYDHNYYFQAMVDFIRNAWNAIREFSITVWNGIKDTLSGIWDTIKGAITERWQAIQNVTMTVWTAISGWLSGLWARIQGQVSAAWNAIYGVISGVWTRIKEGFNSMVTAAWDWGRNLMNNFIDGFRAMFSRLWDALSEAANAVAGFLGFHSPTELGPGRDADKWAPNFIKMFAEGLRAGIPRVEIVVSDLADRLAALSPAALAPAIATSYNTSNAYYGGNTIYIQVSGGGNASDLADQLMRELRKRGVRL